MYTLIYPFKPYGESTETHKATVLEAYGKAVLPEDDTETLRSKVEMEIKRLPTAKWRWLDNGDLEVLQFLPAVRLHESSGHLAFFNNILGRYLTCKDIGTLQPPHLDNNGIYQPPPMVS